MKFQKYQFLGVKKENRNEISGRSGFLFRQLKEGAHPGSAAHVHSHLNRFKYPGSY